jgi:molecular chaperone DnaJ
MKDYYKILGIDKSATKDEIKKAFHKMAHAHHPDKNGGDDTKFKEANEAYQILSDDKKKQQYDTYGSADFSGAGGSYGGFGGFQNGGFDINFEDLGGFGDMFGDLFGGGRSNRSRTQKGSDLETSIRISFKDSVFGKEEVLTVRHKVSCAPCSGSGAEKGHTKTCATCGGAGVVQKIQKTFMGQFATQSMCDTCSGSGRVPESMCTTCRGKGVEDKKEDIKFSIPAGISNGDTMRIRSKGDAVKSGISGDLYVHISVEKDKDISRSGQNLEIFPEISVLDFVLGAKKSVRTLDGEKEYEIPSGMQVGEKVVLRGLGIPNGSRRGDFVITPKIVIPKKLSRTEKDLYEKLRN